MSAITVASTNSPRTIQPVNFGTATRAVEKWQFEPIVENGETVEKRAGVRMMFALE